jgi:hypothetical protein
VASIVETDLDSIIQRQKFFIGNILQEGKTLLGILDRVQRYFRVETPAAFLLMALFLEGSIFFLHPSRIQDHYRKQLLRCRRQQDISSKPFLDELRDEPRVVQVNVGEEETMDLVWRNGESLPVSVGIVPFLKQPAVDKDLHSARIQKIA